MTRRHYNLSEYQIKIFSVGKTTVISLRIRPISSSICWIFFIQWQWISFNRRLRRKLTMLFRRFHPTIQIQLLKPFHLSCQLASHQNLLSLLMTLQCWMFLYRKIPQHHHRMIKKKGMTRNDILVHIVDWDWVLQAIVQDISVEYTAIYVLDSHVFCVELFFTTHFLYNSMSNNAKVQIQNRLFKPNLLIPSV